MESSFLKTLFLLFAAITVLLLQSGVEARGIASESSTEFIKTSCSLTTYPALCFTSLSSHASTIQTSPQLLASTALTITLSSVQSTSSAMVKLLKSQGLNPRGVGAMKDCIEELGDSIDEIQKSIGEMDKLKGSEFGLAMNNIQTWVSAALTDDNTCTDGFEGNNAMNGDVKVIARNRIVEVAQLTSNALALINRYAAIHG